MYFHYETERLNINVLSEDYAGKILDFYYSGREYFIPKESKKPDNFYTLSYQSALARCEYNAYLDGSYYRYFITLKGNPDQIIGTVSFSQITPSPYNSCIIGYKFLPEFQKKGYATEAVLELVKRMFEAGSLHRIEAFCLPDNTDSIKLLERVGFEFESIAKSVIKLQSGYRDHCRYQLINPMHQ